MRQPFLDTIIGNDDSYSIQHRLLNALNFSAVIALLIALMLDMMFYYYIPFYYAADFTFLFAAILLYYFGFFKRQFKIILILSILLGYSVVFSLWYFTGGYNAISGVCFILIISYFSFMIPKKAYNSFLIINFFIAVLLIFIQFKYTHLFKNSVNESDAMIQNTMLMALITTILYFGIYVIKTSHDREQEKVAEQNKRLENLHHVQNQMISIISHDVRSPIGSVQLMLNLFERGMIPPEKAPMMYAQIKGSMANTNEVLESMLLWTRSQIDAIKQDKNTELPFFAEIPELITKFKKTWQQTALDKKISIDYQINLSKNTAIVGDSALLHAVLRNLIFNAIKFTPPNGTITVLANETPQTVIFKVQDTGVGMSKDRCIQLFTDRVGSLKGTVGEQGSGIGLWIINDMLQRVNAKIQVESELGKGSLFTVIFQKK